MPPPATSIPHLQRAPPTPVNPAPLRPRANEKARPSFRVATVPAQALPALTRCVAAGPDGGSGWRRTSASPGPAGPRVGQRERNARHPRILPGWAVLCRVALGKPLHPSEPHLYLEVTWGRDVPVSYLTERPRGSHLQHGCLINVFLAPLAPCAGGSALPPSSESPPSPSAAQQTGP